MRFLIHCKVLILLSILFILLSCHFDSKLKLLVHSEVEWNYLIYMAADNNLERFGIENIRQMQKIGSSENINVLVLFDRSPGYEKQEGNWSGTKLLYITKNPKSLNSDVVYDYQELDMTDSNNLYEFLVTMNKYYPARHTILDIWSHGRGVYPDGVISKSIVEDYSTGYGAKKMMSVVDFSNAIRQYEEQSNKKIDIVQFDACDMQMIEMCYQLKDLVDFVVGAETQIAGSGGDYYNTIQYLNDNPDVQAEIFAKCVADKFYEKQQDSLVHFSYSVAKTEKFGDFVNDLNILCNNLINLSDDDLARLIEKRASFLKTDNAYPEFCDLFEFLESLEEFEIDINNIKQSFEECNIYSKSIGAFSDKAKGLGVNIPYAEEQMKYYIDPNETYELLDFYCDSRFDDFLLKIWECNEGERSDKANDGNG